MPCEVECTPRKPDVVSLLKGSWRPSSNEESVSPVPRDVGFAHTVRQLDDATTPHPMFPDLVENQDPFDAEQNLGEVKYDENLRRGMAEKRDPGKMRVSKIAERR